MTTREQLVRIGQILRELDDDDLYAVEAFAAFLASRRAGSDADAERAGWSRARRRELTERRAAEGAGARDQES